MPSGRACSCRNCTVQWYHISFELTHIFARFSREPCEHLVACFRAATRDCRASSSSRACSSETSCGTASPCPGALSPVCPARP
jgi:hypothetical protein